MMFVSYFALLLIGIGGLFIENGIFVPEACNFSTGDQASQRDRRFMNKLAFIQYVLFSLILGSGFRGHCQCNFKSKIAGDGNLYFYMDPENFYYTHSRRLSGGIITDKEFYYLVLQPRPFPMGVSDKDLKQKLKVKLANDSLYDLKFVFSDYNKNDTILDLMYLIDKKDLPDFVAHEIVEVSINMGEEEGNRIYHLKLHKNALQLQLNCFLEDKKKKKKE